MVNLHDPVVTPQLWHVLAGIFIWEFITTLDYEWRVFRGRLPYRWTIWVYSVARVSCLMGVVLNFVGMDVTSRLNCQSFFCLSLACASLLIVLRMYVIIYPFTISPDKVLIDAASIAIWSRHKAVRVATLSIWGIGVGFHVQSPLCMEPGRTQLFVCHIQERLTRPYPTILSDLVLVIIMLVGLIILSRNGSSSFGLTPLIIKQGIIWLSIAFLSEAPEAVIAMLSSNDQFIEMLLTPGTITMIIAATRMHRYLVDFAFASPTGTGDTLELGSVAYSTRRSKVPRVSMVPSNRASRNRIEVTVHKAFEQHSTAQMNDNVSYETANVEMNEKPTAWDLGDDTLHAV
ncbi:hypothetical protein BJV77DRAFT_964279 [Russula vinacea]|nr:hypothetical protein BJV77DRAFT_964279 [Russula vinacea]